MSSKLSINMGLRNDSITAWKERHDRLIRHSCPTSGGTLVPVGTAPFTGDSILDGRPWNLGPRLGFAYTLTPKTVIRAGGGIFYSFKTVTSGNSLAKNAPFSGTLHDHQRCEQFRRRAADLCRIPGRAPDSWPIAGSGFYYWPQDSKISTMYEWNLNVQRELPRHLVLSRGLCRREGHLCGCGRTEYQPGHSRTRRGGDPAPVSESRRCHGRRAVGQFVLQLDADHVRAPHGQRPFLGGLDLGAQYR